MTGGEGLEGLEVGGEGREGGRRGILVCLFEEIYANNKLMLGIRSWHLNQEKEKKKEEGEKEGEEDERGNII